MQASALAVDLGPFHNRPAELELYQPLVGDSMLELGCKINAPHTYKAFFESLGYSHTSVDWNGLHGSLKRDLREPLGLGVFDLVSNIGTTEHIDGQEGVWRNVVDACGVGSVFVSTTPMPGGEDWWWHGNYYPSEGFYALLSALNGFEIERLYLSGIEPRRMWFCRMVRREVKPFVMPTAGMHYNEMRNR